MPSPVVKANHMNLGPMTTSQQTCRWRAMVRIKLQVTTAIPPNKRSAPVKAHERLVVMSFGVISLWHCAGFVPKGMTKAICTGVSVEFRLGTSTTYLNARDSQREADGDIMTVGPLDGEDSIGNEKERGQWQQGNSKPASRDRFRLNIFFFRQHACHRIIRGRNPYRRGISKIGGDMADSRRSSGFPRGPPGKTARRYLDATKSASQRFCNIRRQSCYFIHPVEFEKRVSCMKGGGQSPFRFGVVAILGNYHNPTPPTAADMIDWIS